MDLFSSVGDVVEHFRRVAVTGSPFLVAPEGIEYQYLVHKEFLFVLPLFPGISN